MKLLGLGDNVCDLYLHTGIMYPGGQALNVAMNAAHVGAQASFLGVFGSDAVAHHVQSVLDAEEIEHTRCRMFPGENGYAKVTLKEGDRVFLGSNRGGVLREHPIVMDDEDLAYCAGFQIIHTSNNSFLDDQLPKLQALPCLVSYDFSGQWTEDSRLDRVCPNIDFAFLSGSGLSEADADRTAKQLLDRSPMVVCITRGDQSALVYDGAFRLSQPPCLVRAIDTMGAGDSFAACFLTRIGQGLERDGMSHWSDPFYRAELTRTALYDAAQWSAQVCLHSGSFGYGVSIPQEVLNRFQSITL